MAKFTMNITQEQETLLDTLQKSLDASSRADVIRKALSLIEMYVEIRSKQQNLCISNQEGKIIERIRII